jgi:AraC-like DNA-binding protein
MKAQNTDGNAKFDRRRGKAMISGGSAVQPVPDSILSPHRSLTDVRPALVQRGLSSIRPAVSQITDGRCEIVANSHLSSELRSKVLTLGMSQIHLLTWTSDGPLKTITRRTLDDPITIYIPVVGNFRARQKTCEVSLDPGRMMIASGRGSLHREFSGRIDLVNVLLQRDKLRGLMRREFGRDDLFGDDDDIVVRDLNRDGPFIHMLGTVLADAVATRRSFEGSLGGQAEDVIATLCLQAIGIEKRPPPAGPMTALPYYVTRAERFVAENWRRSITIDDLAAAAGVSKRTLQYGFRHYRGTTPTGAVKFARIAVARSALINSHERVTDVAMRVGYDDPSHFARDYKRITGEAPRETVRRRRQPEG